MNPVDITWGRALKVWWSYSWRALVLTLLVMIPLEIIIFALFLRNLPKASSDPADAMRVAGTMAILWPVMMAALLALQVQAMRWMLKAARWSDFRVAVLPPDS